MHIIADLIEELSEARAKEYRIPEWGGVEKTLNHPDVEGTENELQAHEEAPHQRACVATRGADARLPVLTHQRADLPCTLHRPSAAPMALIMRVAAGAVIVLAAQQPLRQLRYLTFHQRRVRR